MGTATLVSAQEYLSTSYRPDCDYIDGVLIDRNVGQKDHSKLQGEVFPRLQDRFDDYLTVGVSNVWAIDPASRRAWRITTEGHFEALDQGLHTEDGRVTLPLADLFTL